jgi:hypothetical protein
MLSTRDNISHTSYGFFSYSASRALCSAGLTPVKKPLMSTGMAPVVILLHTSKTSKINNVMAERERKTTRTNNL